jgi:hypothetical protein
LTVAIGAVQSLLDSYGAGVHAPAAMAASASTALLVRRGPGRVHCSSSAAAGGVARLGRRLSERRDRDDALRCRRRSAQERDVAGVFVHVHDQNKLNQLVDRAGTP